MIVKQYMAIVERRRHVQPSLLLVFDEIAQNCLKLMRGGQRGVAPLQSYLDGKINTHGVACSRRSVLLAIHDMARDIEAPLALQRKALSQLIMLRMNQAPKLALYRDIATSILRMEIVIRETAALALKEPKREPILTPAAMAHLEDLREWVHSSMEAVSVGLAGFRTALAQIPAPRLSLAALNGLRYQRPANLRPAIST
jgi:hypothetical protein